MFKCTYECDSLKSDADLFCFSATSTNGLAAAPEVLETGVKIGGTKTLIHKIAFSDQMTLNIQNGDVCPFMQVKTVSGICTEYEFGLRKGYLENS